MIKKFNVFIKENVDYKFKNESQKNRYKDTLDKINNAKIGDILLEEDIYMYVQYLTTLAGKYDECFVDGNLGDRIEKNSKYILKEIEISKIDIEEFQLDDDDVDNYKEKYLNTKEYPPIVLDKKYNILDGAHRVNALHNAGVDKILAFVGTK